MNLKQQELFFCFCFVFAHLEAAEAQHWHCICFKLIWWPEYFNLSEFSHFLALFNHIFVFVLLIADHLWAICFVLAAGSWTDKPQWTFKRVGCRLFLSELSFFFWELQPDLHFYQLRLSHLHVSTCHAMLAACLNTFHLLCPQLTSFSCILW